MGRLVHVPTGAVSDQPASIGPGLRYQAAATIGTRVGVSGSYRPLAAQVSATARMTRVPVSTQLLQASSNVQLSRTSRLAPSMSARFGSQGAHLSMISQGDLAKTAYGSRLLMPAGAARSFRPLPRYQRPERKTWAAPRLPEDRARKVPGIPPEVLPLSRELANVLGPSFAELQRLDVSQNASDALLVQIALGQLPKLQSLLCARSSQLTDQGVLSLAGGMSNRPWDTQAAIAYLKGDLKAPNGTLPCPALSQIDITFCSKTTYVMTLALRRLLPALKCVRRMPVWMTGDNETPFGGKGKAKEVHKYWADGSFSFARAEPGESKGFVHCLQERENGVICEALQYIDYSSEGEWPAFAEFCYRPGLAVKRTDGHNDDSSYSPGLFVWEACDGIRAPANFFTGTDPQDVGPGELIVVRRDGSKVSRADPDDDHPGCLVLSHMTVRPLLPGCEMPPDDVVQDNLRYLLRHQDPTLDETAAETLLHQELGGNLGDDAAWRNG